MDTTARITKIEEFVHLQRYLHGLQFHVIEDPENHDGFIIEFAQATERQIATLNHRLTNAMMSHIRTRAQKVIKFQDPKKQHHKKKHNGKAA